MRAFAVILLIVATGCGSGAPSERREESVAPVRSWDRGTRLNAPTADPGDSHGGLGVTEPTR
jgi:hypothetical protein